MTPRHRADHDGSPSRTDSTPPRKDRAVGGSLSSPPHAFVAYPAKRRFSCVKCGRPPGHRIHDVIADRPSDAERRYHREGPDAS